MPWSRRAWPLGSAKTRTRSLRRWNISKARPAALADDVIITDDNPRSEDPATIRGEILAAAKGAREIGDRAHAIHAAVAELKKGDVLVLAGKGHETGQYVKGEVYPFSDREQAIDAAMAAGGRAA